MSFKGGINTNKETTTLLGQDKLLKSVNFIKENNNVSVRRGYTKVLELTEETDNSDSEKNIIPNVIKDVTIAGEPFLIIINKNGDVNLFTPFKTGVFYKLYRRYFHVMEQITVRNTNKAPEKIEIIETGKYIYILSHQKSWAIIKDGMIDLMTGTENPRIAVVDALEATIKDLSNEQLQLIKTDKTTSYIKKDTILRARFKSELGGRGEPTDFCKVPETNSYLATVSNSHTIKFNSPTSLIEVSKYAIKEYLLWNDNDLGDNYAKVLKTITGYGLPLVEYEDGATSYVCFFTGNKNHDYKPGQRIGVTIGDIYKDTKTRTFANFTVIDNADIPVDMTIDSDILSSGKYFVATYDNRLGSMAFSKKTVLEHGANPLFNKMINTEDFDHAEALLWNTCDGKSYLTWTLAKDYAFDDTAEETTYSYIPLEHLDVVSSTTSGYMQTMININNSQTWIPIAIKQGSEFANDTEIGEKGYFIGSYFAENAAAINWLNINSSGNIVYRRKKLSETETDWTTNTFPYSSVYKCNVKAGNVSNNLLDGTIVETRFVYAVTETEETIAGGNTWFKDMANIPYFCLQNYEEGYEIPVLAAFHEPHNLEFSSSAKPISFTVPLVNKNYPANCNLWTETKIDISGTGTRVAYNPFLHVNEKGECEIEQKMPTKIDGQIKNSVGFIYEFEGPSAEESIEVNNFDCIWNNGNYEIYEVEPNNDMLIAEELSPIPFSFQVEDGSVESNLDIETRPLTLQRKHYPIQINFVSITKTPMPNRNIISIKDWDDVVYFNDYFYYSKNNSIIKANQFLEADAISTITTPAKIRKMASLNNMLFIFTDSGIYSVNNKDELSLFAKMSVKLHHIFGERLFFVTDDNRLYHTEFSPIPMSQQWQLTQNPYIYKVEDTSSIQELADQWNINDISALRENIYVATDKGLFVLNTEDNSWWELQLNRNVYKLINFNNTIMAVLDVHGNYSNTFFVLDNFFSKIDIEVPIIGGT